MKTAALFEVARRAIDAIEGVDACRDSLAHGSWDPQLSLALSEADALRERLSGLVLGTLDKVGIRNV